MGPHFFFVSNDELSLIRAFLAQYPLETSHTSLTKEKRDELILSLNRVSKSDPLQTGQPWTSSRLSDYIHNHKPDLLFHLSNNSSTLSSFAPSASTAAGNTQAASQLPSFGFLLEPSLSDPGSTFKFIDSSSLLVGCLFIDSLFSAACLFARREKPSTSMFRHRGRSVLQVRQWISTNRMPLTRTGWGSGRSDTGPQFLCPQWPTTGGSPPGAIAASKRLKTATRVVSSDESLLEEAIGPGSEWAVEWRIMRTICCCLSCVCFIALSITICV